LVPEALMAYFLRQEKRKNRVYLQMYETYWDKEKKQPRSRSVVRVSRKCLKVAN